jgi:hypothetical protein
MKHKLAVGVMTLLLTAGMGSLQAHANSITITLDNPIQSGAPGEVVSFFATISAPAGNSAPVYLNGSTFDFGASPFTGDNSGLFSFPVFLNPTDSFDQLLFTVTLGSGTTPGVNYSGTFELQGGVDNADQTVLGSPVFTVTALPPAVPEPASFLLLTTGLAGTFAMLKRKRANAVSAKS